MRKVSSVQKATQIQGVGRGSVVNTQDLDSNGPKSTTPNV
uniref:Uncharacterized protein n=1 Tax=Anguilla anguilla TaxID=7936 RepID=A0A0E9WQE8_ANGAN